MDVTFESLGLSEAMLKALEKKGYGYPTTIQAEAIPHFMQWRDVIAKAPTGTGKTFAFGIPMIEHIDPENEAVQGLILAPTRELAIQIGDELRGLLLPWYPGCCALRRCRYWRSDQAAGAQTSDCSGNSRPSDGPL